MAIGDTPQMFAANYLNNTYNTAELMGGAGAAFISNTKRNNDAGEWQKLFQAQADAKQKLSRRTIINEIEPPTEEPLMSSRRIVQVYIADPNENVPMESAILYAGEQKMTDLTDQELFFEIDIRTILEKHNAKRVTFTDKKVKDRVEHLEPAKVRDLKMVVVTVASF